MTDETLFSFEWYPEFNVGSLRFGAEDDAEPDPEASLPIEDKAGNLVAVLRHNLDGSIRELELLGVRRQLKPAILRRVTALKDTGGEGL